MPAFGLQGLAPLDWWSAQHGGLAASAQYARRASVLPLFGSVLMDVTPLQPLLARFTLVHDEELRPSLSPRPVRRHVVSHLITHARRERNQTAIFQLAVEHEENVAPLAPMIGQVANVLKDVLPSG